MLAADHSAALIPASDSTLLLRAAPAEVDAHPHKTGVSCKHSRDSHSARASNWKLQSTYVRGQCEYALAQSAEACRIAVCADVAAGESWRLVDGRAADFVSLRKTSHKGARPSPLKKKLESSLDDERARESLTRSAASRSGKFESPASFPAARLSYHGKTRGLAHLKIPTRVEPVKGGNTGPQEGADDDGWRSDAFSGMSTSLASSSDSLSSLDNASTKSKMHHAIDKSQDWLQATEPALLATLHEIDHVKKAMRRHSPTVSHTSSSASSKLTGESVSSCDSRPGPKHASSAAILTPKPRHWLRLAGIINRLVAA